jgi:hypothetical protein
MAGIRIAAVMAVRNRRALAQVCLDSLRTQHVPGGSLDLFVLDDAMTDGTVRSFGPAWSGLGTAESPPANGGRSA